MKNGILVALLLASSSAFASKARVGALLGADHLVDTQTVFTYPSHVGLLSPYLTFEMGAQGTAAEGGLMRTLSNGNKLLVYLGHQNSTALLSTGQTDMRSSLGYISQQNPVEVVYAYGTAGFGISLSNFEDKKAGTKETTMVLKYSQAQGAMAWYAHLTPFANAAKNTNTATSDKFEGGPRLAVGAGMDDGSYRYFGNLTYGQGKNDLAAGSSTIKDTMLQIGVEDRSLKTDASDIYYGMRLGYAVRDIEGKKISAYNLPAFVGIEHTITSWAVFRASLEQNILLGESKDETATNTDASGISSNTRVASGLGLKYGGLTLDGLLAAASSGQVNGTNFLTQASVTYSF